MLTRKTLKLIAIAVLTLAYHYGADVTRVWSSDPSGLKTEGFHWRYDGENGIILTRVIRGSDFRNRKVPNDVKATVSLNEKLSQFWEIKRVTVFAQTPDDRVELTYQGPYPWREKDAKPNPMIQHWVLYDLLDETYEIELYLKKKKNGMPPRQVRPAVERGNALILRAEPL